MSSFTLEDMLTFMPMNGERMMTRRAGRFTPAASVDVQVRTASVPEAYACSISTRSAEVRPL